MVNVKIRIDWDTENDGERPDPKDLGLPTEKVIPVDLPEPVVQTILDTMDTDAVIDALSDEYGYCIEGFLANIE